MKSSGIFLDLQRKSMPLFKGIYQLYCDRRTAWCQPIGLKGFTAPYKPRWSTSLLPNKHSIGSNAEWDCKELCHILKERKKNVFVLYFFLNVGFSFTTKLWDDPRYHYKGLSSEVGEPLRQLLLSCYFLVLSFQKSHAPWMIPSRWSLPDLSP